MTDRRMLALVIVLSTALPLLAQTPNAYTPVAPIPIGDILLTLPSSHMADRGTWEMRFTHRFNGSVDQGGALHTLFGLDSGANVGLGLSYVPFRDFEVSLVRASALETFDVSGKYLVTQQARSIPFSAAIRAGVDYRAARSLEDRASFYAQAIVSHQFGDRVDLYAMPTFVTNAGRVSSGNSSAALFRHAFNVPVGAAVQVLPAFSVVAEVIPPNRDLPSSSRADLGWAFGVKKAIGGHFFEILLTNSTATTPDQYVTSTFNGGPLSTKDKRLGFNIERRFSFRR